MKPPVICIVGKSKSARTELMEALILELRSRGLSVGALKHHTHGDFEIDIEGKDTWKYAKAGADTVAISSSLKFAIIKKIKTEMDIDEILERYFQDNDIVLADGFTLSDKPRIIVGREDIHMFKRGCSVMEVVDETGIMDKSSGIAERIVEYLKSFS